jgi:predicted acetyltransferase
MPIELQRPSVVFADTFLSGLDELAHDEEERMAWIYYRDAPPDVPRRDFAGFVARLLAREHSAKPGFVTDSVYWAIRDGEMVGRISLRHELNERLRRMGGHAGFIVRPSARRQGVATQMLRQLLATERARAIGRLLVTCDEGNVASERTIRNNGGVLEDVIEIEPGKPRKMRFWISL